MPNISGIAVRWGKTELWVGYMASQSYGERYRTLNDAIGQFRIVMGHLTTYAIIQFISTYHYVVRSYVSVLLGHFIDDFRQFYLCLANKCQWNYTLKDSLQIFSCSNKIYSNKNGKKD